MKLNLDEQICSKTFDATRGGDVANAPEVGSSCSSWYPVGLFASDFITITRESNADWQPILVEAARLILAGTLTQGLLTKLHSLRSQKTISDSTPDKHQQNLGRLSPSRSFEAFRFRFVPDGEQARVALPDHFNLRKRARLPPKRTM